MSNAQQALGGVVGGVIGFAVGGPMGALYGFQAGVLIGSVLYPTQLPGVEGPRLEDFEQVQADPGAPIFVGFGAFVVPGFRMYLGPGREVSETETHGGKGGPEQDVTTFTYYQTIALGLCDREDLDPIVGVTRIWENGELVYDTRSQQEGEGDAAYNERLLASAEYADTFTLYTGTSDQMPDPTLEAEMGVGAVPAFRNLAYIVFFDRRLRDDQGRRHPLFKFEINGGGDIVRVYDVPGSYTWHKPPGLSSVAIAAIGGGGGGGSGSWSYASGGTGGGGGRGGGRSDAELAAEDLANSVTVTVGAGGDGGAPQPEVDDEANEVNGEDGEDGGGSSFGAHCVAGGGLRGLGGGIGGTSTAPGGTSGGAGTTADGGPGGTGHVPDGDPGQSSTRGAGGGGAGGGRQQSGGLADGVPGAGGAGDVDIENNAGGSPGATHSQSGAAGGSSPLRSAGGGGGGGRSNDWNSGPLGSRAGDGGAGGRFGGGGGGGGTGQVQHGSIGWQGSPFVYSGAGGDGGGGLVVVVERYDEATGVSIAEILEWISLRAGLTDIDVSDLADARIRGYVLTRETNAIGAMQPLRMVGLFDIVERGPELAFPTRGKPPVATLPVEELGAYEQGQAPPPAVTTRKTQDVELPLQIRLQYAAASRDYEPSEQLSPARIGTVGVSEITIQCPVILDDDHAARVAEILFRDAWTARHAHEFALDAAWHALEPADALLVPVDGRLQRMRVIRWQDTAGLMLRRGEALRDDDGAYVSTAVASPPPFASPVLFLLGMTELVLLDLPALDESHDEAGFYLAAYRTGPGSAWSGARVFRSVDGGDSFSSMLALSVQAIVGEVVEPPEGQPFTWDESAEMIVTVLNGAELESRTDEAVYAGANAAAIGGPGRWLIVQFAEADLLEPGRYRLSRMLLGRRGTEHLIGTVVPGDRFVLVSGPGIFRADLPSSAIGQPRIYRAVTSGRTFASGTDQQFTGRGQALVPFAPVMPDVDQASSGDIEIEWIRRDRLAETLQDGLPLPLNEVSEAYAVEILDVDFIALRTIETTEPSAVYTAAQQTDDHGAPIAAEDLIARIYQLSAAVGRGIPLEIAPAGVGVPAVTSYPELLARVQLEGAYLYAHRQLNAFGGGSTAILQLNRADLTLADSTSFADAIFTIHLYDGYVWTLGVNDSFVGHMWRVPYDGDGFGSPEQMSGGMTGLDVDRPSAAVGFESDIYFVRESAGLERLELDATAPAITDTSSHGGLAIAVNAAHVYLLGFEGQIYKMLRDLTDVDETGVGPSDHGQAQAIHYDTVADRIYVAHALGLRAFSSSLTLLWQRTYEQLGLVSGSSVPTLRGANLAVNEPAGELWLAASESVSGPAFVARVSAATGAYLGRFPVPGASTAVLARGHLYVNTVQITFPTPTTPLETHAFARYSASHLATIAEDAT